MIKKLLFFDIDGTLVGFDGKMPASTAEALQRAHAGGHRLFLCTGRCRTQIYPWLLADHPFDGAVMCAGANVYAEGKQIYHRTFGGQRTKALVDFLEASGASYFVQNEYGCTMTEKSLDAQAQFLTKFSRSNSSPPAPENPRESFEKMLGKLTIDDALPLHPEEYGDIETAIYQGSPLVVEKMQEIFHPLGLQVTPSSLHEPDPHDGEVTVLGVTKREGMKAVMDFYGLSREDTVAFGDGYNDIQMLSYAGTGVCMGDGAASAKEAADLVTDSLAEDGILQAMERLGLI